jgi:hypothetical protein
MVLITFDENDIEVKKLIDDYFWYKYYVQTVEDEINNFNIYNKYERIRMVRKTLNRIEFERLKDIHKNLFKNEGLKPKKSISIGDPVEDFELKVLYDIYLLGYKCWKGKFKKILFEHSRITKD